MFWRKGPVVVPYDMIRYNTIENLRHWIEPCIATLCSALGVRCHQRWAALVWGWQAKWERRCHGGEEMIVFAFVFLPQWEPRWLWEGGGVWLLYENLWNEAIGEVNVTWLLKIYQYLSWWMFWEKTNIFHIFRYVLNSISACMQQYTAFWRLPLKRKDWWVVE